MNQESIEPARRWMLLPLAITTCFGAFGCDGSLEQLAITPPQDAYVNPDDPGELLVPGEDDPIVVDPDKPRVDMGGVMDPPIEEPDFDRTAPYVRRLTQTQYHNTIRQAFGDVFEDDDYPDLNDAIPTIGFSNNPRYLGLNDTNVGKLYDAVQILSEKSTTLVPEIASCVEADGDTCFEEVARMFGEKMWRRPLTEDEIADIEAGRAQVAAAPGTRDEQAEFIVQALLMNVHALYRTEISQSGTASLDVASRISLSEYEIASALSYTLWNAPPDDTLLALASSGELSDPDVYKAQVTRMVEDERVSDAIALFFVDFLKLDKLYIKEKEETYGLTEQVRDSLVRGVRADLAATLDAPGASFYDPLKETSFHIDRRSAPFFDVEGMQSAETFEQVLLDPLKRHGVLTHPAFLAVHAGKKDSGIVKRGVFTLEQLLCQHLGAPPADISPAPADSLPEGFDPARVTTREALHVQHSSQTACVGCHVKIDPAGYGYENFDSAGRWRTVEKGDIAIDASGSLTVDSTFHDGDDYDATETLEFVTSVDYVKALTGSTTMKKCFTERLMTYVLGDVPSEVEHARFIARFDEHGGELRPVLISLLESPSFITRQIPPVPTEEEEDSP